MTRAALAFVPGPIAAFLAWCAEVRVQVPGLSRAAARQKMGQVTLLGAGPGSADLITLRGLAALKAADVVFYDRLADPALLAHTRAGAARVSVGKTPGQRGISQAEINDHLVRAARRGQSVVRLKCGDPGIFGRGAEEARALTEAGIPWTVIPGVTAACAAAAAAQSFLTERGQTERVVFVTGQRQVNGRTDWRVCAAPGTTLACYMGIGSVGQVQRDLLDAGWPGCSAVEVISKAQTKDQRVLRAELSNLARTCQSHENLNPAILLVRWPEP